MRVTLIQLYSEHRLKRLYGIVEFCRPHHCAGEAEKRREERKEGKEGKERERGRQGSRRAVS